MAPQNTVLPLRVLNNPEPPFFAYVLVLIRALLFVRRVKRQKTRKYVRMSDLFPFSRLKITKGKESTS